MSNEYKSEVGNTQGGWLKGPIFFIIIALVVAGGSFGLGRITKINENREPIKIEGATALQAAEVPVPTLDIRAQPSPTITPKAETASTGQFVASKNGKKYFPLGCNAGKTIKETNKVYFASEDEAKKAGYEASAMCKQ